MACTLTIDSITGVAGPEPDEDGNPVGLVYVTVVARDGRQRVEKLELGHKSKDAICHAAMQAASGFSKTCWRPTCPDQKRLASRCERAAALTHIAAGAIALHATAPRA